MTRPHAWEAAYPPGLRWDFAPPGGTLLDLLAESAAAYPDRVFLEYQAQKITYAEFAGFVDSAAAGLLRLGLETGETIALYLPNSPYHPVSFFAVLKAGGVVVHLSPLDAERELIHKLHDSGATTLITTNLPPMLPVALKLLAGGHITRLIVGDDTEFGATPALPIPAEAVDFSDLLNAPAPKAWPAVVAGDTAVLQYTGGTTGAPKGAIHTHATLRAATGIYHQFYTAQSEPAGAERVIAVLPFFHIYGLVVILLWQLHRGATLLLHLRFEPAAILKAIETRGATYFPGVPTMWIALAAIPGIENRDFSSLRQLSSGGAPLPPEVARRFQALAGRRIGGGWGMTETAAAGTSHLMMGAFNPESVGVPLPGVEVRIIDLADPYTVVGPGERGEIAVRGPNLFKGYWRGAEEPFVDGFFLTGDIGMLDALGMLHIVDRKKDMILSGGFNVYPTTIEAAIYEHEAVEECIVIGVPDAYRGQAAKAFIKLREGAEAFTLEALRAFLGNKLGRHELPAALEFREALPKTPVGKLSKKALKQEVLF